MTTETEDRPRFDIMDSGIGSPEMEILSSQSTSLVDAKFNKSMESLNMDDLGNKTMTTSDLLNKQSNNTATKVTNQTFLSPCEICCKQPKNASLIHGKLGHQVCCYTCGKKLWKKQSRCPVCRRVVEKIVKIIQAQDQEQEQIQDRTPKLHNWHIVRGQNPALYSNGLSTRIKPKPDDESDTMQYDKIY